MNVVIAGASGLLGSALVARLRNDGHTVRRLVRRPSTGADEISWNPDAGELDATELADANAIINLAGENLGEGRWTTRRRERILRSRVDSTRTLVVAIAKLKRKPNVLLNASAVGFYGDRGDERLTEQSVIGRGFLPEVCLAWETHAEGAVRSGVRTVLLRFGVVLAREGGALAKMLPVFRAGLCGRLGTGRQWMSWVSLPDVTRAVMHAMLDQQCNGPVNVVAPGAVTNREFTATLTRVLRRPALLRVPAWALRLALGRMADETLLASTRAAPQRLIETGFVFQMPTLEPALRAVLAV